MLKISTQIDVTKTLSAVFGNEKGRMCLIFIKNKGFVCSVFSFFFFFPPLLGCVVSFWSALCECWPCTPQKSSSSLSCLGTWLNFEVNVVSIFTVDCSFVSPFLYLVDTSICIFFLAVIDKGIISGKKNLKEFLSVLKLIADIPVMPRDLGFPPSPSLNSLVDFGAALEWLKKLLK